MKQQPIFRASYSDWKLIKSRRVVQIVMEVSLEDSGHAYEVLGGMPRPDAEIWCGVARLNPGKEVVQDNSTARNSEQVTARQLWREMGPAQQSGILRNEKPFWRFLAEQGTYDPQCKEDAVEAIHAICGVRSCRDIEHNHHARIIWDSLVSAYRAWQKMPECVG